MELGSSKLFETPINTHEFLRYCEVLKIPINTHECAGVILKVVEGRAAHMIRGPHHDSRRF